VENKVLIFDILITIRVFSIDFLSPVQLLQRNDHFHFPKKAGNQNTFLSAHPRLMIGTSSWSSFYARLRAEIEFWRPKI